MPRLPPPPTFDGCVLMKRNDDDFVRLIDGQTERLSRGRSKKTIYNLHFKIEKTPTKISQKKKLNTESRIAHTSRKPRVINLE